jgi:hypothetical protein
MMPPPKKRKTAPAPTPTPAPAPADNDGSDNPDDDDGTVSLSKASKAKKIGIQKLALSSKEEDELAEWVREHPDLYDKSSKVYKDIEKRRRLWRLKAEEMGVDVTSLMSWYENMRTRYVKLVKTKSGDGIKDRTEREDWLIKTFAFLHHHIMHRPGRGIVTLKSKANEPRVPPQSSTSTSSEMREEEEEEDIEDDEIMPCNASTPTAQHSRSHFPPLKKGAGVSPLYDRVKASRNLHEKVQHLIDREVDRPTTEKELWGQWMASVSSNIHDDLWVEFQDWSYNGLKHFKSESLRISQAKASQSDAFKSMVGQTVEPGTQDKAMVSVQQQQLQPTPFIPDQQQQPTYQDLSFSTPKPQENFGQQHPVNTMPGNSIPQGESQATRVNPSAPVCTPNASFSMDMSFGTLTRQILGDVQEF